MKKALALLTVGLFYTGSILAQSEDSHPSVDVSKFDVSGIQIGMGVNEVKHILSKKYGFKDKDFQVLVDPETDEKIGLKNLPRSIIVSTEKESIFVSFISRYPLNKKNPMAAVQITYELKNVTDKKEAAKTLMQAAISKYGKTSNSSRGWMHEWCKAPKMVGSDACSISYDKQQDYLVLDTTQLSIELVGKGYIENLNDIWKNGLPKTSVNF